MQVVVWENGIGGGGGGLLIELKKKKGLSMPHYSGLGCDILAGGIIYKKNGIIPVVIVFCNLEKKVFIFYYDTGTVPRARAL